MSLSRQYDDLSPLKKLEVSMYELIDNGISAMTKAGIEDAKVVVKVHRERVPMRIRNSNGNQAPRQVVSISIMNTGMGMDEQGIVKYWTYKLSQEEQRRKMFETKEISYVDGRLNFYGEGAKMSIFLSAGGGIVVSRVRGNENVSISSVSNELLEINNQKNKGDYWKFPYLERKAGVTKITNEVFDDPMYAEYYKSELNKELTTDIEKNYDDFTYVILYDIHPDLVKYLSGDKLAELKKSVAHTYHYYLHPETIPVFLPREKPKEKEKVDAWRFGCLWDPDKWKFRSMDIELTGLNETSSDSSLKKYETKHVLYHKRATKKMYFMLSNGVMGQICYMGFKDGEEQNPDYVEGVKVHCDYDGAYRKINGVYRKHPDPPPWLKALYINVYDSEYQIANTGYKWSFGTEDKKLLESTEKDAAIATPDKVKQWYTATKKKNPIIVTVKTHASSAVPMCEAFWHGRRLIKSNFKYSEIDFLKLHGIRAEIRTRMKVMFFFGSNIKPKSNKLEIGDVEGKKITEFISKCEGERVNKGEYIPKKKRETRRKTLKTKIREFVKKRGALDDRKLVLKDPLRPKHTWEPNKRILFKTVINLEGNIKYEKGQNVRFKRGGYGKIMAFRIFEKDLAVKDDDNDLTVFEKNRKPYVKDKGGFVAGTCEVLFTRYPEPERKGFKKEILDVDFFKMANVARMNMVKKFCREEKIRKNWPFFIEFSGIENESKPWKVEYEDSNRRPVKFIHSKAIKWRIGSKEIFKNIRSMALNSARKPINSLDTVWACWTDAYSGDKKMFEKKQPAGKTFKFPKPGRWIVQFFVDNQNKPWRPVVYEMHIEVVSGVPHKIIITNGTETLPKLVQLGERFKSRLECKVVDEQGNSVDISSHLSDIQLTTSDERIQVRRKRLQSKKLQDTVFFNVECLMPQKNLIAQEEGGMQDILDKKIPIELAVVMRNLKAEVKSPIMLKAGVPKRWEFKDPEPKNIINGVSKMLQVADGILRDAYGCKCNWKDYEEEISGEVYLARSNERRKYLARATGAQFSTEVIEAKAENFYDAKVNIKLKSFPAKCDVRYGQKILGTSGFKIKSSGRVVNIDLQGPKLVRVGSTEETVSLFVYRDNGELWKPERQPEEQKWGVDIRCNGQSIETTFDSNKKAFVAKFQAPTKLDSKSKEDMLSISYMFKNEWINLDYSVLRIPIQRGNPKYWERNSKNNIFSSGSTYQEKITLRDEFGNKLKHEKMKAKILNSDKETVRILSVEANGTVQLYLKGFKVGEYTLQVPIPSDLAATTDLKLQVIPGEPKALREEHEIKDNILRLSAYLVDGGSNQCFIYRTRKMVNLVIQIGTQMIRKEGGVVNGKASFEIPLGEAHGKLSAILRFEPNKGKPFTAKFDAQLQRQDQPQQQAPPDTSQQQEQEQKDQMPQSLSQKPPQTLEREGKTTVPSLNLNWENNNGSQERDGEEQEDDAVTDEDVPISQLLNSPSRKRKRQEIEDCKNNQQGNKLNRRRHVKDVQPQRGGYNTQSPGPQSSQRAQQQFQGNLQSHRLPITNHHSNDPRISRSYMQNGANSTSPKDVQNLRYNSQSVSSGYINSYNARRQSLSGQRDQRQVSQPERKQYQKQERAIVEPMTWKDRAMMGKVNQLRQYFGEKEGYLGMIADYITVRPGVDNKEEAKKITDAISYFMMTCFSLHIVNGLGSDAGKYLKRVNLPCW
eukprot:CAMPEP_0167749418 /NCGR_PEP_ID=MMETSP0110_2-20121227/5395_1 /TAXON_ID=629695 /ORGANISM="Gymnochlora sp., Strain CCMP2014" /LENGTH=1693 /DNA_ID=CAMNT_0007634567 /DNA_START=248 /DNA_END=5326 /DNA_ORIENTATION=-